MTVPDNEEMNKAVSALKAYIAGIKESVNEHYLPVIQEVAAKMGYKGEVGIDVNVEVVVKDDTAKDYYNAGEVSASDLETKIVIDPLFPDLDEHDPLASAQVMVLRKVMENLFNK